MTTKKEFKLMKLAADLYFLRYIKEGEKWYELMDCAKDKLESEGYSVSYQDKEKTLIIKNLITIK